MLSMMSNDHNYDAQMLRKANNDLTNQMYHLNFLVEAYKKHDKKKLPQKNQAIFEWLLVKVVLKLDKSNRTQ